MGKLLMQIPPQPQTNSNSTPAIPMNYGALILDKMKEKISALGCKDKAKSLLNKILLEIVTNRVD